MHLSLLGSRLLCHLLVDMGVASLWEAQRFLCSQISAREAGIVKHAGLSLQKETETLFSAQKLGVEVVIAW